MEKEKSIYIMLTDTGTWLNKIVKRYTEAPYNHSSIGLDDSMDHFYSFGRKNPKNPFSGGFVKEDVVKGTYRLFPNTSCVIYRLTITEEKFRKVKGMIRKFEENHHEYSYNFIGLLAVMIDKPVKRKTAYFCSQFIAEILHQAGIHMFDKEIGLIQPDDFRKLPNVELIYEGKLYEYHKVMDKIDTELVMEKLSKYRYLIYPIKKSVKLMNPVFYYQYAITKLQKEEK